LYRKYERVNMVSVMTFALILIFIAAINFLRRCVIRFDREYWIADYRS